jgi:hypothetical protein
MIRVDLFTGEPMVRAMLWPQSAIPSLLQAAQAAGHVSKVSQLDQYHQFTLAGTGEERMRLLLGSTGEVREASAAYGTVQPAPTRKRKSSPNQLSLFDK